MRKRAVKLSLPSSNGSATAHQGKIGVLLINLGTPEKTSFWSVRRYLREFLGDKRVIEAPRPIWWFILHVIILNTRPAKSGRAYAKIWDQEHNESPLKIFTRNQSDRVAAVLGSNVTIEVDWAMRYGLPSIQEKIDSLSKAGCDRILLFPLYPQYSATTTATVQDKTFDVLKTMRWQPAIRTVPAFYDHPLYIKALAQSLQTHLQQLSWKPDLVLASYHGLPVTYIDKGDPYYRQCLTTSHLMTEQLGWDTSQLQTVFQSRFGRQEWLQPYAEETICDLAQSGIENIVVLTPGFVSDCLETLEEVAIDMQEMFLDHGGRNFSTVPCLNDDDVTIRMLSHLIQNELAGWID